MDYKIKKSRHGLYISYLEDGTELVTGLTEEAVRVVTEEVHIPVLQGTFTGYTSEPAKTSSYQL